MTPLIIAFSAGWMFTTIVALRALYRGQMAQLENTQLRVLHNNLSIRLHTAEQDIAALRGER